MTASETKSYRLQDFPIVEIDINEIKDDPTNPNVMTLEQERGLEKSMMKFGRLKYIVVDQNNVIIDGYHRLQVEKAIGTEKVNVIKVNLKSEIDRKIIRETLNKLHGNYDKQKESDELLEIFQSQGLEELSELLAQPMNDLLFQMNMFNEKGEGEEGIEGQEEKRRVEGDDDDDGVDDIVPTKEFNSSLSTSMKCPSCGYQW